MTVGGGGGGGGAVVPWVVWSILCKFLFVGNSAKIEHRVSKFSTGDLYQIFTALYF